MAVFGMGNYGGNSNEKNRVRGVQPIYETVDVEKYKFKKTYMAKINDINSARINKNHLIRRYL